MVHPLAAAYNWTHDYIVSLTLYQVQTYAKLIALSELDQQARGVYMIGLGSAGDKSAHRNFQNTLDDQRRQIMKSRSERPEEQKPVEMPGMVVL